MMAQGGEGMHVPTVDAAATGTALLPAALAAMSTALPPRAGVMLTASAPDLLPCCRHAYGGAAGVPPPIRSLADAMAGESVRLLI